MVSEATCSVEGCDRPRHSRGWCSAHARAWHRHGDPLGAGWTRTNGTVEDRFWRCVDKTDTHWMWTGEVTIQGYGRMSVKTDTRFSQAGSAPAHVVSYVLNVGPVPDGLVLDHTCFVKACVNPAHLEPVTQQENVQRYWRQAPERERCSRGHDLLLPNSYYTVSTTGQRQCRLCVRENQARHRLLRPHSDRDSLRP